MRLLTILILVGAALPALPVASAHDCNGYDCGPCVRGEYHNHNDGRGQCASGPGYYASNGWGGQKASWSGGSASNGADGQRFAPGGATLAALFALAGAALLMGRR